jgi:LmbE family N-acetylglucosaminyl deacetylase
MMVADVLAAMERLPYADLDTLLRGDRPLILAPHADDESLGCGGFIAACCEIGLQPAVVILTDGAASHPGSKEYPPERLRQVRAEEARRALSTLGLASWNLAFFDYPDSALPIGRAISARVARFARDQGCAVIFAPWLHDPHCDHEAASIIAQEAAQAANCRLFSYPVWGWLLSHDQQIPVNQVTGYKLPITGQLRLKQTAIAAHASQYSNMVKDSPNGFRLPRQLLSIFERPYEVFLRHE